MEGGVSRKLAMAKALFFATAMASVGWQRFQNIFYLQQGLNPAQIGELKSLGLLLKFIGEPFWCLVADMTDMKTVFAFCLLMQICTMELLRVIRPLTFSTLLIVKILRTTTAPAATFTTIASFRLTEGTKEGYGHQRLFGSLAWGLGAFTAGYCIDAYGMDSIFYYTYFFNFIAFLIVLLALPSSPSSNFTLASCVARISYFFSGAPPPTLSSGRHNSMALSNESGLELQKLEDALPLLAGHDDDKPPASSSPSSPSSGAFLACGSFVASVSQAMRAYLRMVGLFLSNAPCRLILLNSLCYGVVMQVPDTYLFISLERDFHASKSYSGFCTTVSILACLPLFWYSQALIQRYGHHRLIYVAESLAVVRLVLYSFLLPEFELSLYLILAVQLLHGFNFALFWSASVDAMFRFSPKDLSTSSMALLNMVYFTGGGAVGSLVWGFIYEWGGGVTYVYLISSLTLLVNVLYFKAEEGVLVAAMLACSDSGAGHNGEKVSDDEAA